MTITTHGNLLTWWESEDGGVLVEVRRHHGAYLVRTLRAGQTSAQWDAATDMEARKTFERVVTEVWNEMRGEN